MSKPYKIECFSETGVRIVTDIIADNEGHFVVEGLAIVTDYQFTDLQTHACIACVSKTRPYEDLTSVDLQLYAESMEK